MDILSEHATCFVIRAFLRRGGGIEPPLIRGVPFRGSWRMARIKFGEFRFRRGQEANYLALQLTVLN